MIPKYEDAWGRIVMICSACSEETVRLVCCEEGEVAHFVDCDCKRCARVNPWGHCPRAISTQVLA